MAAPAQASLLTHQRHGSAFRLASYPVDTASSDDRPELGSFSRLQYGKDTYAQRAQQCAVPLRLLHHNVARSAGVTHTAPASHSSEHMLRRKTPFGTFAAAYDASPTDSQTSTHTAKRLQTPFGHSPTATITNDSQPSRLVAEPRVDSRVSYAIGGEPNTATSSDQAHLSNYYSHASHLAMPDGNDATFADLAPKDFQESFSSSYTPWFPNAMPPPLQPAVAPTVSHQLGPYGPYWPNRPYVSYQPDSLRAPRHPIFNAPLYGHVGRVPEHAPNHVVQSDDHALQQSGRDEAREIFAPDQHLSSEVSLLQQPLKQMQLGQSQDYDLKYSQFQGQLTSMPSVEPSISTTTNSLPHTVLNNRPSWTENIASRGNSSQWSGIDLNRGFVVSHSPEEILQSAHKIYNDLTIMMRESCHNRRVSGDPSIQPWRSHTTIFPDPICREKGQSHFKTDLQHGSTLDLLSANQTSVQGPDANRTLYPGITNNYSSHQHRANPDLSGHRIGIPRPSEAGRSSLPNQYRFSHQYIHHYRISDDTTSGDDAANSSLPACAAGVLNELIRLCDTAGPIWTEGMLVAGCLAYVLSDFQAATRLFTCILKHDPDHVEAISNLAATYLAINHRANAESLWRLAIKLRPRYFDAVEHLVGMLCSEQRSREAVLVIDSIQLKLQTTSTNNYKEHNDVQDLRGRDCMPVASQTALDDLHDSKNSSIDARQYFAADVTGRGKTEKKCANRYRVSEADNGRLIALLHAKGNLLYNLQERLGAARAFEEVVLVAGNQAFGGIDKFIRSMIAVMSRNARQPHSGPLLLPPEQALRTVGFCFVDSVLPGLRHLPTDTAMRAAVAVTSNSLLSLAKIFQDGLQLNQPSNGTPQISWAVGDILALYYLSLSLLPSPSTANNVGILMAGVQQTNNQVEEMNKKASDNLIYPGVVRGSGVALALQYYNYGLSLDSKHAHLYTNLGSLLKDFGQLSSAVKMYERAVLCEPNFDIALANLANAKKDQGKTQEAITYYKRAVQVNPKFAEAVCGLANALNSICSWQGRGGYFMASHGFDRWHVDDEGSLVDARMLSRAGSGWLNRVFEIVESQLAEGTTHGVGTLQSSIISRLVRTAAGPVDQEKQANLVRKMLESWYGCRSEGKKIVRLVERAIKSIGWQWYQDKYVDKKERPLASYERPQLPATLSCPNAPTVLPFHTFTIPMTAKQIRQISQRNGLRVSTLTLRSSWLPATVFPPPAPPSPCLKIGYVSSDFNNHPLAHLMQSVFGMHDVSRAKAFCYATTASDNSVYRQQIEREAPAFRDASSWSTERLVKQIVQDGIHILVNLNGYTRGARNEVFAARPAPIQMAFMGFAGTLGAEWCDYLLADSTVVPESVLRPYRRNVNLQDLEYDEHDNEDNDDWVYSENIIYARNAFFCCDHRQSGPQAARIELSWQQMRRKRWIMRKELFPHLDDKAIIFGNFNQLYKIDPTTFRTWLRILSRVPNAILWLLRFPDLGEQYVRKTAHAWAGPSVASRLVFTDVAPKATHIARACIADLFLDTPECNAHTTSADCLWSGTPLLTQPRYTWKMCSRFAASILGSALPLDTEEGRTAWSELVAQGEDEYEDAAVRLATGVTHHDPVDGTAGAIPQPSGRLVELRKMIWTHRAKSNLFDTQQWVRDLEDAYEEAWRRWEKGEGGDIWLKDIAAGPRSRTGHV